MLKHVICGRDCNNKEGDLNRAHSFPRVQGIRRDNDIIKGDITKVRESWNSIWILLLAPTISW